MVKAAQLSTTNEWGMHTLVQVWPTVIGKGAEDIILVVTNGISQSPHVSKLNY